MEEDTQHFWHIMLYNFEKGKNATETQKWFVQCMEKVLWLMEHVISGLCSFSVLLTLWPNKSLPWDCLMHWKMFSSTPGLYPLDTNSRRELTYSKYSNQYSYWWKWKMCLQTNINVIRLRWTTDLYHTDIMYLLTIITIEKILRSLQHMFLESLMSTLQSINIIKVNQMSAISWASGVICIEPIFAIAFFKIFYFFYCCSSTVVSI